MTQPRKPKRAKATTPTEQARRRVRELRARHGWSARELAERVEAAGVEGFNRSVLANFESGRRNYLTVDELATLALVLDVSPLYLVVPLDDTPVRIGPLVEQPLKARSWWRGYGPVGEQDERIYSTEKALKEPTRPEPDDERFRLIREEFEQALENFAQWRWPSAEGAE